MGERVRDGAATGHAASHRYEHYGYGEGCEERATSYLRGGVVPAARQNYGSEVSDYEGYAGKLERFDKASVPEILGPYVDG